MTRERMIKERRREEAETLRGGGMRWMLKMRERIQKWKEGREKKVWRKGEDGRGKERVRKTQSQ